MGFIMPKFNTLERPNQGQEAQHESHEAPRAFQETPGGRQETLGSSQEAPGDPGGPQRTPRRLPGGPQEAPRRPPGDPRSRQEAEEPEQVDLLIPPKRETT